MHSLDILERIRSRLKISGSEEAKAAVAILFRRGPWSLELLLVKRAQIPSDPWSGDMALPGGKRGPEDEDLMETARREVLEETSIELNEGSFLGVMEVFFSTVKPDLGVLPHVFLIEGASEVKLNEELSSFLWVPLRELMSAVGRTKVKNIEVPVYHVKGEVVWGLTHRMLEKLLKMAMED